MRSRGVSANVQLLVWQNSKRTREEKEEVSGPTPRRLLHFVTRRLRLRRYFRIRETVPARQIPAQLLLWAVVGKSSVNPLSCRGSAGAFTGAPESCSRGPFPRCVELLHGTLGSGSDRQALFSIVSVPRGTKPLRIAAGSLGHRCTSAGWRTSRVARSVAAAQRTATDPRYQHYFVMISVVGTGLSLPLDVEPYGLEIASMLPDTVVAAGDRQRGKALCAIRGVDGNSLRRHSAHRRRSRALCGARLKDNLPELFTAAQQRFACCPPL